MMKRNEKKCKITILCVATIIILCISLVVYNSISISGVDRDACYKSVNEIRISEFFAGNIKPKKIDYYIIGQIEEWDESAQIYRQKGGEKAGVLRITYSGGNLIGVPVKEFWYTFNEDKQTCRQVTYQIDIKYKDKFLEAVKKKFGEKCELTNVLIERENFIFSVETRREYFIAKTVFK